MKPSLDQPELKHLLLIGGGHAQIAVLRNLAMDPIPGLRVTLISRDILTPYSGMLPGYLEGCYRADEITIDLSHLARLAGARFIAGEINAIDPAAKTVTMPGRPPLTYDILSINIGSATDLGAIRGGAAHGIPIKPISTLLNRLEPVLQAGAGQRLMIIGGGAAGVETALSLHHRLNVVDGRNCQLQLVQRSPRLTPEYPEAASRLLHQELEQKEIDVRLNTEVAEIHAGKVTLSCGEELPCDLPLVVTAGAAPSWLNNSGLELDRRGFIAITRQLQSRNHPEVFATGDIATLIDDERPKAGVFAVRAGKVLAANIRRCLLGQRLQTWFPQKNYLALVGTGGGKAMAVRGALTVPKTTTGWKLKEWIDRRFIERFSDLPTMGKQPTPALAHGIEGDDPALAVMRCLGCGAKAGHGTLHEALGEAASLVAAIHPGQDPLALVGDDAARLPIGAGHITQSVDAISAIIEDPFLLGQVAAFHALSDLHASHAKPVSALALITLPAALARLQQADITQILAGAMLALAEDGVQLAGGHTAEGPAMQVGFAVTGEDIGELDLHQPGDGDQLILTKPLGTGMIMAGHGAGLAAITGIIRAGAIASMASSNGKAASILNHHGGFPMTDVTGFGLARHLLSLLERYSGGFSAELRHGDLPLLPGVDDCLNAGIASSLAPMNSAAAPIITDGTVMETIYHDPQTGGGLLAIVPVAKLASIRKDFEAEGLLVNAIGSISADGFNQIRVIG